MLALADPAPDSVSRIASAGAEEALVRFSDPALLAEGKVVLVSLDAIVARLGKKWALRCDQVYEHADRTLDRLIGPQGYHFKLSDSDYLVCQPEISRFTGQAACLRALREILSHFLGSAHGADVGIHEVVKVGKSTIETCQLDAASISAGAAQEAETTAPPEGPHLGDAWAPFVDAQGRQLRVSCAIEPVFELKGFARIGMRMRQSVRVVGDETPLCARELSALPRADILRVDLETVARGLDRLRAEAGDTKHPTLFVPVSYTSLSSTRGCGQVVALLKEASSHVRQGLICEITDIEGVPQSALTAVLSLIRPFTLYTVGRLSSLAPGALSSLKDAGLNGLSFDIAPANADDDFIAHTKASIEAARRVTRTVMACGATSAHTAGVVATLGATHVSLRS